MSRRTASLVVAFALSGAQALRAQLPAGVDSMLHRIFASGQFAGAGFAPVQWTGDGAAYTTVEPAADSSGGSDIVRYETATGARTVVVSARDLTPPGATAPLQFDDYTWSADESRLLLFTNTRRVWRQNTRGDYWVFDRARRRLTKLGGSDAPPSSLMYAKFSPAGDRVAYVRQGDLYAERLADGAITRLTSGADSLHVSGMTDWVYEEEFGLRDGFRWSPDGTMIAFWHFDMTGVRTFYLINDTDSLYPTITPIQYPKAGTTNSAVTAGVVRADGGPVTWLRIPGDARENYLPRLEWAGPGEILVQQMNRLQDTDRVMLAHAATGAVTPVLTESDGAWVDAGPLSQPWLAGGREFLWESDRDGWRHVYRVARDGGRTTLVTAGAFDVTAVAGVDEAAGWLYYVASPTNATQRYLYRTRLDGRGGATRLSPAGQPGTHGYSMAPGARWALHTYSTFDRPGTVDLIDLPSHRVVRSLVSDDRLRAAVAPLIRRPGEFFAVTVPDGATLDGWMIKPADFDSTRTYPVLMFVYGESAAQTALDAWGGGATPRYRTLADQGYLVVSVDNRGTPAPKGRAWRKAVYGRYGILPAAEQADAAQVLARTRPYVDPTRIGIWGWSGGGSTTLNAMFRFPDVFAMGMAVSPVADPSLYDTIYQERYLGTPQGNPEGYRLGSPINFAQGLRGPLLVMHGSGDDNVHYQGTERLLNRLIELGKPVDFMVFPNRTHCICQGEGTTLYVFTKLTRYLFEHLPAGPRSR